MIDFLPFLIEVFPLIIIIISIIGFIYNFFKNKENKIKFKKVKKLKVVDILVLPVGSLFGYVQHFIVLNNGQKFSDFDANLEIGDEVGVFNGVVFRYSDLKEMYE